MGLVRKILLGKTAYNLDKKSLEVIKDPQYKDIILSILGPVKRGISDYCHKGTFTLKPEFVSVEVVDYIYGFICSGLRVNRYGELYDVERYEKLKEAFLVGTFGVNQYLRLLKAEIFISDNNVSQEFNQGEYDARIRKHKEGKGKGVILFDDDLPELGAILSTQKLLGKIEKKRR